MSLVRISPATVLIVALLPSLAFAGGTPVPGGGATATTPLIMQQGGGASTANGDFISAGAGLNATYRYWVEVPAGTGSLTIEYFDIDQGTGGGAEATNGRDRARSGFDTGTFLDILNPNGASVASTTLPSGSASGCENTWCTFTGTFPIASPIAGHWEVVISNANSVTGGDDIAAVGVRAHDGTPGAGGTELNVYAESFFTVGVNNSIDQRTYTLYPYVFSGCNFESADFDWDANATSSTGFSQPYGSLQLDNRDGTFTHNNTTMSNNDAWQSQSVSGYTTDTSASGYGLWTETVVINSYAAGNYGVNYFRAFNADGGEPPPTAQPENNSYRIYMPADGGGAPAKTYVEQLLTHLSGPNPPQVGQVSTYTVTVRVVNPEAQSVTFSTPSNVVTADIPGGVVVYAGNAQVSQGTITSQPAIGASGSIVWNPGTVTAGATAGLAYRLNVSPTVPAARIPVTGTPAANGTTAQYVDITGNTTQGRATQLFGPLCELAVTENGTPTVATVVDVRASSHAGGVALAWETASEVGTESFEIQRMDATGEWLSVGTHRAPASLAQMAGNSYQFFDAAAPNAGALQYRLIESDTRGARIMHGPFSINADASGDLIRVSAQQPSFAAPKPAPAFEAQRIATQLAERASQTVPDGLDGVARAMVNKEGLHRVDAQMLAEQFGLSIPEAQQRIANGEFQLNYRGVEIPWFAIDGALVFYAEHQADIYNRATGYLITLGTRSSNGPIKPEALGKSSLDRLTDLSNTNGADAATGEIASQFFAQQRFEQDLVAFTAVSSARADDYWRWGVLVAGHPNLGSVEFPFALDQVADGTEARIMVDLQGASHTGVIGEHHLEFRVNGLLVDEARFTGVRNLSVPVAIPAGVLVSGTNTLEVTALNGNGAASNVVWVDGMTVTYPRQLVATGDQLTFELAGHLGATVTGFTSSDIAVFDITSVRSPRAIGIQASNDGGGFAFSLGAATPKVGASKTEIDDTPPSGPQPGTSWDGMRGEANNDPLEEFSPGYRYVASTWSAIPPVQGLQPVWATAASELGSGADWLIISPQSLESGAQALASYRAEDGLETAWVSTEAIYDAFNDGQVDPEVIRNFLEYTQVQWNPAPQYVLLAGRGTSDHRDLLGHGDHLLTSIMMETDDGLVSVDPRFADFGDLGLPAIAVGRLPVLNNAELHDYVTKLNLFERSRVNRRAAVAMVADNIDGNAGDFAALADSMATQIPASISVESHYLDDAAVSEVRDGVMASLNQGVNWLNLVGHSGIDRFAHESLVTRDDVELMDNLTHLPVVTAFSCLINRADIPGVSALGERLVVFADGGAIASWGAGTVIPHDYSVRLGNHFAAAMADSSGMRIGDLILAASLAYHQELTGNEGFVERSLPLLYNLIGDPAALINF